MLKTIAIATVTAVTLVVTMRVAAPLLVAATPVLRKN
jgi:hypothetical protein